MAKVETIYPKHPAERYLKGNRELVVQRLARALRAHKENRRAQEKLRDAQQQAADPQK